MKRLLALATLLTITALAQTPAAELLQRAIYAQDTAGNLDEAIKIYHQIVDSHPQQREIGAQAQYRLGMALIAKGDTTQASQEIQRLGWDYPDYKDLVAAAKVPGVSIHADTIRFSSELVSSDQLLDRVATARTELQRLDTQFRAQPAAHEALFDFSKSDTITGTVASVQMANPYSILIVQPNSGPALKFYLASANVLATAGWMHNTVTPGDRVTITGAPALDGSLQATDVSVNGTPRFSRPAIAMGPQAVKAYEQ